MINIEDLLKPNGFKIILAFFFLIPSLFLVLIILGFFYSLFGSYAWVNSPLVLLPLTLISLGTGLLVSYSLGSLVDYYIQSRNIKILIALISGFISIIIVYVVYKMISEPVICDPVHVPSSGKNYSFNLLENLKIDKGAVRDSFNQCIQYYYK